MSGTADPREMSIDDLFDWLRQRRTASPDTPLGDLLAGRRFDRRWLIDLACIDLMQRRRLQAPVTAEDYLREFPELDDPDKVLDLIDAELCVRGELGERPNSADYLSRFPSLAAEIEELIRLEGPTNPRSPDLDRAGDGIDAGLWEIPGSSDFSVDVLRQQCRGSRGGTLTHPPIEVPEWFVAEQWIDSSPGKWLVRGRDSARGVSLALKIMQLPERPSADRAREILDACEAASRVEHAHWVRPRVAALHDRFVGVIRPWIFANSWDDALPSGNLVVQLRQLAAVAYTLQAAHASGAAHGGIRAGNLWIDHDGTVRLIDAAANGTAVADWWDWNVAEDFGGPAHALAERIRIDRDALCNLVRSTVDVGEGRWAGDLRGRLNELETHDGDAICAKIGDLLIRQSDAIGPDLPNP